MKTMTLEEIKQDLREKAPDFAEKVAPMYKQLNWTWAGTGIPDKQQIFETIVYLINTTNSTKDFPHGTGGLTLYLEKEDVGLYCYGIRMEIECDRYFGGIKEA